MTTGDERSGRDAYLTIQQASRLLQVPAPTLRSWERRYGIPAVERSTGGHRRYTPEHVRMLRRMRDAIAHGQSALSAAQAVKATQLVSTEPLVEEFLSAAERLDSVGVRQILDSARTVLGLDRTVDELLFPAMQQIGRDWRIGRCDVAHEHLATETSRAWLSRVEVGGTHQREQRPIVLASGPRDQHTLGLESIGALLRYRGWDCRLLGASLPVESLHTALRTINPSALVLVSHLSVARRSAVESLRTARASRVHVFYAGNAFLSPQSRQGVPGIYLGENLSAAADLITRTVAESAAVTDTGS